jgi:hypothetical protein
MSDTARFAAGRDRAASLDGTELVAFAKGDGPARMALAALFSDLAVDSGVAARAAHLHDIDNFRAWWQQMNGEGYETDQLPRVLNNVNPSWEASGFDYPGSYRNAATTGWLSFRNWPLNRTALVDVASGSCTLYAGDGVKYWRGSGGGLSLTQSTFTSVVFDAANSAIVLGGGDPVAEGYAVDDVVEVTGVGTNNGTDFRIVAFGGASNRTITISPAPADMSTPDTSFALTRLGKKQLALTLGQVALVRNSQGNDIACVLLPAHVTTASVTPPTAAFIYAADGQSWDKRAGPWVGGIQLRRQGLSLPSLTFRIDAAVEAQAMAAQEPVTANAAWDIVGNQPGKNYAQQLAAWQAGIAANPSLTLRHHQLTLGSGDIANLTTEGGWLTWQMLFDAHEAWAARMMSDLSLPDTRIWISPLTARHTSQGGINFTAASYNLIRFVQMRLVALNAAFRRSIEMYHWAQPFDDGHQSEKVMGLMGAAWMHHILRDDDPATYKHGWGPKVTAFTQEDARVVRMTISRLSGFSSNLPNVGSLVKPMDSVPYGFGICPGGDLTAASVGIRRHEWIEGTNDLRLFLAADVADPIPVYPYGPVPLAPISHSNLIRVWDRVLGQYRYLQTIAHSYDPVTGRWAPDFTT